MPEARRTLVKSPPELWAEISDPECLSRHLEAFGEIRITRTEPETTVAWEGERARGTVELEASGWGTKVRLTAETIEVEEEPALQQPLAADPEPPPPEPEPQPEPVVEEEPAPPESEASVDEEPPTPPPAPTAAPPSPTLTVASSPTAATSTPVPAATPKRGFFARWFGRRDSAAPAPVEESPVVEEPVLVEDRQDDVEEQPVVEQPVGVEEPVDDRPVVAEDEPVAEEPAAAEDEPVAEEPAPAESPEPITVDEPPAAEITISRLGDDEATEILAGVLDTLGAAHHRPFSRS
jgi:hypothetical protein